MRWPQQSCIIVEDFLGDELNNKIILVVVGDSIC